MTGRGLGCRDDLLLGGVRLSHADISLYRVVKEIYVLKDDTNAAEHLVAFHVPYIHTAQPHRSPVHIPEPGGQTGDGGLPGTGRPHQRGDAPSRESQGDVVQNLGFPIAEGYMVKHDICSLGRLTNCRFRQGLFIKKGLDPFSASAGAGEVRDEGEQCQDRLIDRQREDQKGNVIVGCQLPAGQQYNAHENDQPDPAAQSGPAQHAHRRGRAGLHADSCLPLLVK